MSEEDDPDWGYRNERGECFGGSNMDWKLVLGVRPGDPLFTGITGDDTPRQMTATQLVMQQNGEVRAQYLLERMAALEEENKQLKLDITRLEERDARNEYVTMQELGGKNEVIRVQREAIDELQVEVKKLNAARELEARTLGNLAESRLWWMNDLQGEIKQLKAELGSALDRNLKLEEKFCDSLSSIRRAITELEEKAQKVQINWDDEDEDWEA